MSAIDTNRPDVLRPIQRGHKPDYKQKLEHLPASKHDDVLVADVPRAVVRVRALTGQPGTDSVAFQCVAAAALQTLERVRRCEADAAEAALSLAQRQTLDAMIEVVDATADALRETLTTEGLRMVAQNTLVDEGAAEHSWWFVLSEALHVLEESITWIRSVAAGQPTGSPTRALGDVLIHLLHQHHDALLDEAEQWMN